MTFLKKAIKWYCGKTAETYMWMPTGMIITVK
jgi:hypothetical protein